MLLGKLPLYKLLKLVFTWFIVNWHVAHISRVLHGQKVQQLKHNWLEPKQMMKLLLFLRKTTTKQTKMKPTPAVSSWDTQNTGTGKQKTVHKAQLKSHGYISGGEIHHASTHIQTNLWWLSTLPLTASGLMVLQSDRRVLSILWWMFSHFLNLYALGHYRKRQWLLQLPCMMLSWDGAH